MGRQVWVLMGCILGVGAGLLGAYAGWLRANSPPDSRLPAWVAGMTLGLALGLGAVAVRLAHRAVDGLLFSIPVTLLGYWFMIQVRAIRSGGKRDAGNGEERCHRG